MISPSVGRVVWFWMMKEQRDYFAGICHPLGKIAAGDDQPMAALVTYVHGDRCVNLAVFDHNGAQFAITSVILLQDDDAADDWAYWAEWMPFQKGQASKAEALEKALASAA